MNIRYGHFHPLHFLALFMFPTALVQAVDTPGQPPNTTGVTFPSQAQLGNIFATGETVRIQAAVATGASVDWVVKDFQEKQVGSGTAAVTAGGVTIQPDASGLGFFVMTITAHGDGAATGPASGAGTTCYAVLPPLDNAQMADARFGVASHFGKFMLTDLAPILAKAGIAHVRDSMDWSWVETRPGVFDFTVHDFTDRVRDLDRNHIATLFNVCFGNPLHFDDPSIPSWCAAPHNQEQYTAFSDLCGEHLKAFGPLVKSVEIWNEYNGSFCKGKAAEDRPKYYTEMLKDAYAAIKAKRPDIVVLGGALNGIPLPYAEKLFQHGALDAMDGIVIHCYGGNPTICEGQVRDLVEMMKKYNHGVAKPIWVTEMGDWGDKTLVRADAAETLTKMYAMLLDQPEVARAYWYLARDYPDEGFPTMGLVHVPDSPMGKYTPTTVYAAYATMAKLLFHAQPKGHEAADPRTTIYHFEGDGSGGGGTSGIWVAWSEAGNTSLVFQTRSGATSPLRAINLVGGEQKLIPVNGQVTVTLDHHPVYLIADNAADVAAVRETPRPDRIIADATTDFSATQGGNGWSYFTYEANADGSAPYAPDQLKPMTYGATPGDWGFAWNGPAEWYCLSAERAQPKAGDGKQYWAVRRWTSTVDGDFHLLGKLSRGEHGDGDGCRIFIDGRQIYTTLIPPDGEAKIDQTITVKKGSQVDFAVTPGPGTDASYDSLGFTMSILTGVK